MDIVKTSLTMAIFLSSLAAGGACHSVYGETNAAPVIEIDHPAFGSSDTVYLSGKQAIDITIRDDDPDPSYIPVVFTEETDGFYFSGWHRTQWGLDGRLSLEADGEYRVFMQCMDLSGHAAVKKSGRIIVDSSKPSVEVTWQDGQHMPPAYASKDLQVTIKLSDAHLSLQGISLHGAEGGWQRSGDTYEKTILFDTEGEYALDLSVTDMAGNRGEYHTGTFVIDKKPPQILVEGVADGGIYRGPVAIDYKIDESYPDKDSFDAAFRCFGDPKVSIADVPKLTDGIYALDLKAGDLAGNLSEKHLKFTIDQNGSVYSCDDSGKMTVPRVLEIVEANPCALTQSELSCSVNGKLYDLEKFRDYEVFESLRPDLWHRYRYVVKDEWFSQEGVYIFHLLSEDEAGNQMTNQIKGPEIRLLADYTPPGLYPYGLDDMAIYRENTHAFTLEANDNFGMDKVWYYVDGHVMGEFTGKEIEASKDLLALELPGKETYQTVWFMASDLAGNLTATDKYTVWVNTMAPHNVQMKKQRHFPVGAVIFGIPIVTAAGIYCVSRKLHVDDFRK